MLYFVILLTIFVCVTSGHVHRTNENPYAYLAQLGSGIDVTSILPDKYHIRQPAQLVNLGLTNLQGQLGNLQSSYSYTQPALKRLQALGLLPASSSQLLTQRRPAEVLELLQLSPESLGISAETFLHHQRMPLVEPTVVLPQLDNIENKDLDFDSLLADLKQQTELKGQNMHQESYAWGRSLPVLRAHNVDSANFQHQPKFKQPFSVKKPHHFEIYHYI